jgi:PIN domain nuclease of toxin-antitoxin system
LTTVQLDTHVVAWSSLGPELLSPAALKAIREADELVVADISWFELAWLVEHDRIRPTMSLLAWLNGLAEEMRTAPVTPAIAMTAVTLPSTFPGDPQDRLIYATAIENGWDLVSKDELMHRHSQPGMNVIW